MKETPGALELEQCFQFTPGAIFIGWVGRVPEALVSGITELEIDLIYSKEIPCLLLTWERIRCFWEPMTTILVGRYSFLMLP